MSVVDDLIENLVERNAIVVKGGLTVTLVPGGVRIKGRLQSTIRDQKKSKNLLNAEIPVDVNVGVGDVVIPLPKIV